LSYPAFALPGSRAPGSRPLRSDLHQCHPAVRKPSEKSMLPGSQGTDVTRPSRVPTVCPPAVERADCTLYASTRHSGNRCDPAVRNRSESRCDPAASDVTRPSRVPTVCHPTVGCQSTTRRSPRRPGVRDLASMLPGVRRLEEPGGAGPRRRPPAPGPPRQPPEAARMQPPSDPPPGAGRVGGGRVANSRSQKSRRR